MPAVSVEDVTTLARIPEPGPKLSGAMHQESRHPALDAIVLVGAPISRTIPAQPLPS